MVRGSHRLLPVLAVLVACVGAPEADGPPGTEGPTATYTLKGRVVTLPADNGGEIRIAHEAIDDFVGADGSVIGMDAMTMSFVIADGVGDDLAVGDVIEFDLRVDWSSDDLATVLRAETLPPETEMVFEDANPPSTTGTSGETGAPGESGVPSDPGSPDDAESHTDH